MGRYLLRRSALAIASLFALTTLVFVGVNFLPGDPATAVLGKSATPEKVASIQKALGLNKPIWEMYTNWITHALQLDFGHSLTYGTGAYGYSDAVQGTAVSELIGGSLKNTAILASVSMILLIIVSLSLGVYSAMHRGSIADSGVQFFGLFFLGLPEFVLGALIIIAFAFYWPILPAISLDVTPKNLVLPVLTLVLVMMGSTVRLVRVGVIEVLKTNYVVTARLRGIPERRIIMRYVIPNAIAPVMQVFAIATGLFVGGVVVVEYLFGYPGIGTGFVSAASGRDYPVVQAYAVVLGCTYIVANIAVDLIALLTNPKMRAKATS
jgi:peptide/nickel transport system permease protein